jgi:predicted  nucleic acid-binding Zn-ribbon protein
MKIIEEYKRLTEEIAVLESKLESARRELKKQMNQYKPGELKGIDYSDEKVQTSTHQQDMLETYDVIKELQSRIKQLEEELMAVLNQRQKLEDVIDNIGGRHKRVMMLYIQGKEKNEIAEIMSYDPRHVLRLKDECETMIEQVIY